MLILLGINKSNLSKEPFSNNVDIWNSYNACHLDYWCRIKSSSGPFWVIPFPHCPPYFLRIGEYGAQRWGGMYRIPLKMVLISDSLKVWFPYVDCLPLVYSDGMIDSKWKQLDNYRLIYYLCTSVILGLQLRIHQYYITDSCEGSSISSFRRNSVLFHRSHSIEVLQNWVRQVNSLPGWQSAQISPRFQILFSGLCEKKNQI